MCARHTASSLSSITHQQLTVTICINWPARLSNLTPSCLMTTYTHLFVDGTLEASELVNEWASLLPWICIPSCSWSCCCCCLRSFTSVAAWQLPSKNTLLGYYAFILCRYTHTRRYKHTLQLLF